MIHIEIKLSQIDFHQIDMKWGVIEFASIISSFLITKMVVLTLDVHISLLS